MISLRGQVEKMGLDPQGISIKQEIGLGIQVPFPLASFQFALSAEVTNLLADVAYSEAGYYTHCRNTHLGHV